MKNIKKFNETKKDEKVKDQEVLFSAEVLVDKDEKPSFKTDVEEDQEKVKKEFDKLRKVKSFENFTVEVEVEVKPDEEESKEETDILQGPISQEVGCGCCDDCNGQSDCGCCQDCTCGQVEEIEQTNPETDVKVMNMSDFINSITGQ
jgi:hypothetical protein